MAKLVTKWYILVEWDREWDKRRNNSNPKFVKGSSTTDDQATWD